jgi:hypothetical protein
MYAKMEARHKLRSNSSYSKFDSWQKRYYQCGEELGYIFECAGTEQVLYIPFFDKIALTNRKVLKELRLRLEEVIPKKRDRLVEVDKID